MMDDKDARIAALEAELAAARSDNERLRRLLPTAGEALSRALTAERAERALAEAVGWIRVVGEECSSGGDRNTTLAKLRTDQRELAAERKRREDAEAALGEVVDCNNSDPILISREPGYRWYDVIEQATAHFARYKD